MGTHETGTVDNIRPRNAVPVQAVAVIGSCYMRASSRFKGSGSFVAWGASEARLPERHRLLPARCSGQPPGPEDCQGSQIYQARNVAKPYQARKVAKRGGIDYFRHSVRDGLPCPRKRPGWGPRNAYGQVAGRPALAPGERALSHLEWTQGPWSQASGHPAAVSLGCVSLSPSATSARL